VGVTVVPDGGSVVMAVWVSICVFETVVVVEARVETVDVDVLVVEAVRVFVFVEQARVVSMQEQAILSILAKPW
jgi:hypothetical protein